MQVQFNVEDLCIIGRKLVTALDTCPIGDLVALLLSVVSCIGVGMAAFVTGGQLNKLVEGRLLHHNSWLDAGILESLLIVSE